MNCYLCGTNTKLQSSHIIPEFIYKPMYDKKHRFMEISLNPYKKIQLRQKGLREELLCNNCEQKIGKYEKYVSEFIYRGKCNVVLQGNAIYLKGLDYKKVRICYLSILWRMSIASCDVFKSVSLGMHEQKIKGLIFSDNPGRSEQYGFMCFAPLIDGKFYSDLILQPVRGTIGGHITYWVVIGGLMYIFFVSSHDVPQDIKKGFIQDNGDWIITVKDARKIDFLNDVFTKASKANRKRCEVMT